MEEQRKEVVAEVLCFEVLLASQYSIPELVELGYFYCQELKGYLAIVGTSLLMTSLGFGLQGSRVVREEREVYWEEMAVEPQRVLEEDLRGW